MSKYTVSYPGVSLELVLGKNNTANNFYELVSSCGVFCRMPTFLQLHYLKILKNGNDHFRNVTFITDSNNKLKLEATFKSVFPDANILSFDVIPENNELGLRVNRSNFRDKDLFRKHLINYPENLIIVSTPFSCPNLYDIVENKDSISNRSALLFFENKSFYENKFKTETGFIESIDKGDIKKLEKLLNNDLYFLKLIGEYTGGSTVIPINKDLYIKNKNYISKTITSKKYNLYKNINDQNVISEKGEHFGTQIRPFIDNNGYLKSFIIKFSTYAIKNSNNSESLKSFNKIYNSSGGNSISILFEVNEIIQPISVSLSKHKTITNKKHIFEIINQYTLNGLSLNSQDDLQILCNAIFPKAIEILDYFEEFFFNQKWEDLYKKCILEKTFFNG